MATEIANLSRTRLVSGLRSLRSRLGSIRETAEMTASRLTVAGSAAGGAYVAGRVIGNYQRDGKDLTVGDSEINWTLPIGAAMAVAGAVGGKMLGEQTANIVLGLGIGALSLEVGMMGVKAGLAPATPVGG